MNQARTRNIVIGLIVLLLILILLESTEDDYTVDSLGISYPSQSYPSLNSEIPYSLYSNKTQTQSPFNRHEILQTKVNGYREQTYWGLEHPIDHETKYLNKQEFDRFVRDNIESKDNDVYWGAEY